MTQIDGVQVCWHLTDRGSWLLHNVFLGKGWTRTVMSIAEEFGTGFATQYQLLNRQPKKKNFGNAFVVRRYRMYRHVWDHPTSSNLNLTLMRPYKSGSLAATRSRYKCSRSRLRSRIYIVPIRNG